MSRAFASLLGACGLLGLVAVIGPQAQAQQDTLEATCTGRTEKTADERVRACSTMIETGSFEGDSLAILYTSRGSAWRTKDDLDRALADQNEAVRIRPDSAIFYFNRAATWQAKRDAPRAIRDYDQALRIAPNFTLAFKRRGDLHFNAANYDLAVADYGSALRLKPDYAEALVRRGLAKLERGDVEGRNADLQEAHFLERGIVKSVIVSLGDDALRGQGFLVPRRTEVFTALMLDGATVCLEANQTSQGLLKAYFDAQKMRFTSKPFPNLTDAVHAFTRGDCTVLAAEIPTLRDEFSRFSNSREYALLPEIFGPTQKARPLAPVALPPPPPLPTVQPSALVPPQPPPAAAVNPKEPPKPKEQKAERKPEPRKVREEPTPKKKTNQTAERPRDSSKSDTGCQSLKSLANTPAVRALVGC